MSLSGTRVMGRIDRQVVCDVLPAAGALAGAILQRTLHHGVELGLLVLCVVVLALPALNRLPERARATPWQLALAASATLAGLWAGVSYPLPFALPVGLLGAGVVVNVALRAAEDAAPHLTGRDGAGLAAVLALNLLLRQSELLSGKIAPYFDLTAALQRGGAWRLLLPLDIGGGSYRWSSSGLVVVSLLETFVGSPGAFQLLNCALIVVAFGASWVAFHSRVFSLTMAVACGLGTQFHYSYVNSSCLILYLFTAYLLLNLLCLWQVATGAPPRARWRWGFIGTLLLLALCWEMWLDYAAFLLAGQLVVWTSRRGSLDTSQRQAFHFLALCTVGVLVAYFPCKLVLGGAAEHMRKGQEAEVVLTYFQELSPDEALWVSGEDVVVNALTYNHIALTNYAPPSLVFSPALQSLGSKRLLAQHAGHGTLADPQLAPRLVLDGYVYDWRFLAGALSLALYCALGLSIRAWILAPSGENGLPVAFLLLVTLGSATHLVIKFRFYNAFPLLSYKCVTGILGVTLLLAWMADRARVLLSASRSRNLLVALWLLVASGALTRPPCLAAMCEMAGLGRSIPDPLSNARALVMRAAQ